jgi:hypothetical protein
MEGSTKINTNAVAQHEFDILGGVVYIIVLLLEIGIILSHLVWLFRSRDVRAAAAAEEKTFDDILQEKAKARESWKFSERAFDCSFGFGRGAAKDDEGESGREGGVIRK